VDGMVPAGWRDGMFGGAWGADRRWSTHELRCGKMMNMHGDFV